MASIISFSAFTFTAEQIRDVNELVFDEILHAPDLNAIHTLFSGVEYDKEIGFITGGGLVGVADQGCSPTPQDFSVGTRKVTWQPKAWEVFVSECSSELANNAATYARNKGVRVDDLTDTDYMAIVVAVLTDSVKDFMYRLAWFNDTDADNVDWDNLPTAAVSEQTGAAIVGTVYAGVTSSTTGAVRCSLANGTIVYLNSVAASGAPAEATTYYTKDTTHTIAVNDGGLITAGVDTDYFDLIDGYWKQLSVVASTHSELVVAVTANASTTKAAQLAAMNADAAYALLSSMYYAAPIEMRGSGKMRFLVTQSIADAYQQYLIGKGIESTYKNLVDGVQSLSFLGAQVIPMPFWDKMIRSYNDLGATYYKPHRALLVEQANLAIGTPSEEAYGAFDIWFDKTNRKNYVLIKDKFDAKLLNDRRLVLGW